MGPRLCDELLTLKEVSWQLGVTVKTVRRWIASGDLRIVQARQRASVRVSKEEVHRLSRSRLRAS